MANTSSTHFNNASLSPQPEVKCRLLKLTADYIFFEKATGVHSVALESTETNSAANWLLSVDPKLAKLNPLESGLVHRLDQDTSGIMIAARHAEAHAYLSKLFREQEIEKIYHCLTRKPPPLGILQAFAGKHPKSQRKVGIALHKDQTRLRVKGPPTVIKTEILSVQEEGNDYRVMIRLHTGYRHQIRAHLAALECPIRGDEAYGAPKDKRLYLHAASLAFEDTEGKLIKVESPTPF